MSTTIFGKAAIFFLSVEWWMYRCALGTSLGSRLLRQKKMQRSLLERQTERKNRCLRLPRHTGHPQLKYGKASATTAWKTKSTRTPSLVSPFEKTGDSRFAPNLLPYTGVGAVFFGVTCAVVRKVYCASHNLHFGQEKEECVVRSCSRSRPFVDRQSGPGTTNILCRPIGQTSRSLFIPFMCRQRTSPCVADLRFRLAPPERAPWARTCDPSVSSSKRKFKKSFENTPFALQKTLETKLCEQIQHCFSRIIFPETCNDALLADFAKRTHHSTVFFIIPAITDNVHGDCWLQHPDLGLRTDW